MGDNEPGGAQEAWRELLDVLRASDRSFLDGDRGGFDEREIGYGYRNLTHIVAFATGMYMNADPEWPMFVASLKDPPGEKTLGEHPDVHYRWASVRGGRRYRITGRRGDEAYLSFTVHGEFAAPGRSNSSTATSTTTTSRRTRTVASRSSWRPSPKARTGCESARTPTRSTLAPTTSIRSMTGGRRSASSRSNRRHHRGWIERLWLNGYGK